MDLGKKLEIKDYPNTEMLNRNHILLTWNQIL